MTVNYRGILGSSPEGQFELFGRVIEATRSSGRRILQQALSGRLVASALLSLDHPWQFAEHNARQIDLVAGVVDVDAHDAAV